MLKWEFATYANKSYHRELLCCIKGFEHFTGIKLKVYALDSETAALANKLNVEFELINPHKHPQVTSLRILQESNADILFLIDADCWVINYGLLDSFYESMKKVNIAAAGDVGLIDIPYLFKGIENHRDLFEKLHDTMDSFPKFFGAWSAKPLVESNILNTGCVVDLPLLYGGVAAYRTARFKTMIIPDWIYSADIFISMFIYENSLSLHDVGEFQFNTEYSKNNKIVHFAGPKMKSNNDNTARYLSYLGE
jgi:hypothetical protein